MCGLFDVAIYGNINTNIHDEDSWIIESRFNKERLN